MSDNQMIAHAYSVKDRLRSAGEQVRDDAPPKPMFGAMVGTLNRHMGGDEFRKIALAWLFAPEDKILEPLSSKKLSFAQAWAVINWIGWWRDEEEAWHVGDKFSYDAICVLNAAIQAYNMARRGTKQEISEDSQYSLVTAAVEVGGVVTQVSLDKLQKELEDLSKIDKKEVDKDG